MTLQNMIDRKELDNASKLDYLKKQINASIDELRKISYDLAPTGIMEFTIENALSNLCNQISDHSDLQIEFSAFGEFSVLDMRTKIYVYRIVQEALLNTLKHAEATQIQIQLTETHDRFVLMIEDNGKGFDYNMNEIGLGKGLFNMRERSILLNGNFDIESLPGKGTTIRVKINKPQVT
jgi:signal transduction histidine kinase